MIEILHEYWKPLLWTDGYRFTGVAITLWLLILSVVIGGVLALFLAIGRVSSNKYIQFPIWLFTYIFRGTPLYVQLLVFYSGMYTLEIVKGTEFLNAFFRSGLNCTVLALTLNTCAYTTEIFAGAIRSVPHGEIEAARAYGFSTFKMYRCIILPSALRIALPAYSNEVILMLHSTALAFTATVPDRSLCPLAGRITPLLPCFRAILQPRSNPRHFVSAIQSKRCDSTAIPAIFNFRTIMQRLINIFNVECYCCRQDGIRPA